MNYEQTLFLFIIFSSFISHIWSSSSIKCMWLKYVPFSPLPLTKLFPSLAIIPWNPPIHWGNSRFTWPNENSGVCVCVCALVGQLPLTWTGSRHRLSQVYVCREEEASSSLTSSPVIMIIIIMYEWILHMYGYIFLQLKIEIIIKKMGGKEGWKKKQKFIDLVKINKRWWGDGQYLQSIDLITLLTIIIKCLRFHNYHQYHNNDYYL